MAQDIQSIINELNAGYDPQRQLINQQIAQIQPQADQQIAGLKQQQQDAFGDITNQARDRGMGFSGIPLQEQAKYTSSTFLPAVANVQKSINDQKTSLLGSLNSLTQDQYTKAAAVRQGQLDTEEKQREFDQQLATQKATSAAQSAAYGSMFGGGGSSAPSPQTGGNLSGGRTVQQADADVRQLINSNNAPRYINEINAIQKSAQYGNTYDQAKLQLLQKYMPGWFVRSSASTNGNMMLNSNYLNRLAQAGQLKFRV